MYIYDACMHNFLFFLYPSVHLAAGLGPFLRFRLAINSLKYTCIYAYRHKFVLFLLCRSLCLFPAILVLLWVFVCIIYMYIQKFVPLAISPRSWILSRHFCLWMLFYLVLQEVGLYKSMHLYVWMCVCVCMYVCMHVMLFYLVPREVGLYKSMHLYVCMFVCMYVCVHVCTHVVTFVS